MRKTLLFLFLLLLGSAPLGAQTFTEWQDPHVNAINRLPMHSTFLADESEFVPLAGQWSFHWVRSANQRPENFWRTNFTEVGWSRMQLPGVWELNGYGTPVYVNVDNEFRPNEPPFAPTVDNPVGCYVTEFDLPESWKDRLTFINFGAVKSAYYVWVNGQFVGYTEDAKTNADFDLTPYVKAVSFKERMGSYVNIDP